MSPATPAAPGLDSPKPRFGPFRSSPSPARPSVRPRGTAGRLRIMLYRHRWLRWAAAVGAALAVLAALGDGPADPPPAPEAAEPPGRSSQLPPDTRGVSVPVDSEMFAAGDVVDVHAVLDGAAVVLGAPVVSAGEDEVILAVPVPQVDPTVDALTTGGVVLVLVPTPANRSPGSTTPG